MTDEEYQAEYDKAAKELENGKQETEAKADPVKTEEAKPEVKAEETVDVKDTKEVNASETPVTENSDIQDETQIAEEASAEGEGLKD